MSTERQEARRTPSAPEVLGFAIVFGFGTGFLEVLLRGVQKYVFGAYLFVSRDLVWMAPLADASLFLLAGVALLAGRSLWSALRPGQSRIGYATVFGTFAALVPLGPLLMTPRIHNVAALILSVGIGVQVGRFLARRVDAVRAVARNAAPVLALGVLAGLVAVRGGAWLNERQQNAGLPEPAPGSPSVLLIILDTVRAADLSLYGYDLPTTPNLERLAEIGVTFESVVSTSPWTLTSHASMFTGRYPHELTANWLTPLDDSDLTLAEHFTARGYRTAGFVGNLIYTTWETGLDRGFARYEDFPASPASAVSASWLARWLARHVRHVLGQDEFLVHKSAGDIGRDFLAWLDAGAEGASGEARPFFAFLNFMEAHGPYLPPDSLDGRFGPERTGRAPADLSERREWSPEALAAERAAYDGEIAYADQEIGTLIAALEQRGLLESTLLVVTSDHGEQFGEHGLTDHANSLYRPLLDVPLVVALPGRLPANVRIRETVSLRDLTATIADLATDDPTAFPGRTLLRFFDPGGNVVSGSPALSSVSGGVRMPDWVPVARGDMRSLVADGYHYIIDGNANEELFRYSPDRGESENLADSAAELARLAAMRGMLEELSGGGAIAVGEGQ